MGQCIGSLLFHVMDFHMMTSSHGNIFRVTGHLCGEFTGPTQRPVTRSFDVFFDLRPNKRLSKQWWGWWFETPSRPLWRHRNGQFGATPLLETWWLTVKWTLENFSKSFNQNISFEKLISTCRLQNARHFVPVSVLKRRDIWCWIVILVQDGDHKGR